MRKYILGLLLMFPLCGFAQKGMQGMGIHFGSGNDFEFGTTASSVGLSYQNNLSDRFRMAYSLFYFDYPYNQPDYYYYESYNPDYYYYESYNYGSSYLLGIEGHYFINDVRRFRPYVIGGIYFGSYETDDSGTTTGLKLGVGLNYRVGYRWTAQMEIPLYLIDPVGCFIPTLGITYNF